jgi:glycosyltransferase involved in cell wall biosynthesis
VIARRAGGSLDTVIEDRTGTFFDEPTPEAIAEAISRVHNDAKTSEHCRENALRFSEQIFADQMNTLIKATMTKSR